MDQKEFAQGVLDSLQEPAILLNNNYDVLLSNEPYRQRYGLMAKSIQKCHQISHRYEVPCDQAGESCPLKTCLETGGRARTLHIHHSPRGQEYVNVEMWPIANPTSNEIEFFIEQIFPVSDVASVQPDTPSAMVGKSKPFRNMLDLVQRVAPSNSNVLLLGETGTGKDMVAQTIHRLSQSADGPFVPVECIGLPESLFESELFGHVKGAFTGATANKIGLVEAAEGGTLFLDEVGDIPLHDQVKLLRLLETRRFRRVGSTDWCNANFRLVCATNKNLKAMVEAGSFRADLFYRLSVFEIELPPLRERRDDIPLLVQRILSTLGSDTRFSNEALACLSRYDYPGNVRELRNLIERAILLTDNHLVQPNHLPDFLNCSGQANEPRLTVRTLEEVEQEYLGLTAAQWRGDRKGLAKLLGVSERVLYRKLARLKNQDEKG